MATHAELVEDFIAAWHDRDIDRICAFLADDIRYHNMPLEPIDGLAGTRKALQGLLDRVDDLRWDIRYIAEAPDGTVLYEKTEHYLIDGSWVALPCMIALEFDDADLIGHWRAYFDVATWTRQHIRGSRAAEPAICFVCLGNICRSPAAAAVFADLAAADGVEVTVDSAGHQPLPPRRAPHEHTLAEAAAPGHRRRAPGPAVHGGRLRPLRPRRGDGRGQPARPAAAGARRRRRGARS